MDYGADAVYIGGARFGARQAAANSVEEIGRVVEYAHRYGVRVYATMNTLVRDDELAQAEADARALIDAGVDALIVQDMAYRRMNLPVELHASTQTATRTPEQAAFLAEAGFSRVILERALSLAEIRTIVAATKAEVECFVHGAICVGYSGRCFLSRSMSDRSGNRGACSQPCRLTWDLTDGHGRKYISGKHLLSVRDMNLSARIGEMLDAGVRSLKIEGRLKDENYIRNVVAYYRKAVDEALSGRAHLQRASVGISCTEFVPDPSKSFTRGESEYFFDGKRRGVASFDTPKAIGERIGRIRRIAGRAFEIDSTAQLSPGDGICFMTSEGLVGTNINSVEGRRITPNRMDGIAVGMEIFRNYDHRFNRSVEASRTRRVIPATARVALSAEEIRLQYTDCEGFSASVSRSVTLDTAKNPEANATAIRTQAARSGDTIFAVGDVMVEGTEWFAPSSVVAEMRREALDRLVSEREKRGFGHRILPENMSARYPAVTLRAEENVTNRLAEEFYRDHGVARIEPGLDFAPTTSGHEVMRTAYCLRREIGECLRENPRLRGDLFLERGGRRYRLEFDCRNCEMSVVDEN